MKWTEECAQIESFLEGLRTTAVDGKLGGIPIPLGGQTLSKYLPYGMPLQIHKPPPQSKALSRDHQLRHSTY